MQKTGHRAVVGVAFVVSVGVVVDLGVQPVVGDVGAVVGVSVVVGVDILGIDVDAAVIFVVKRSVFPRELCRCWREAPIGSSTSRFSLFYVFFLFVVFHRFNARVFFG